MNVHSCILVRLLHLFVFSKAQTVPQSTRSACRIPVLMQPSLKMNPPMIGFERRFSESGSGVVSWVATFFVTFLVYTGFQLWGGKKDDDYCCFDSTDIGECQDVTLLDNSHHTPKIPKILTIVARRLVVMIGSDDW